MQDKTITAMYLWEGISKLNLNLEPTGGGNIELAYNVLEMAEAVTEYLNDLYEEGFEFDGVIEYEAIAPLGEKIARHISEYGEMPSQDEYMQFLLDLI